MRILLIGFCILLTSLSCKNRKESAEFFTRGNFHFKKKEFDQAEHFFTEAIRKDPKLADAYNNRGLIYLEKGEMGKAGDDFKAAVDLDKTFTDAHFNLAKWYSETGNTDAAQGLLDELSSKLDTSAAFHNAYGQNFVMQNKFSEGEKHLKKAIDLSPTHVQALTNLAYVYTVQHRDSEAVAPLEKALTVQGDFIYALNNRAVLYGRERRFTEALALLEKAEKKDPKSLFVLNNLALFSLESGNLEQGQRWLKRAEVQDENDAYYRRNKGLLAYLQGDNAGALAVWKEVEKSHPEVDYLYYYLSKVATGDAALRYAETAKSLKDPWINQ